MARVREKEIEIQRERERRKVMRSRYIKKYYKNITEKL